MFGKTEWPPQGDMSKPNERGSVSQFAGKRYVSAGIRSEPGASGLMKPSTNMMSTTRTDWSATLQQGQLELQDGMEGSWKGKTGGLVGEKGSCVIKREWYTYYRSTRKFRRNYCSSANVMEQSSRVSRLGHRKSSTD